MWWQKPMLSWTHPFVYPSCSVSYGAVFLCNWHGRTETWLLISASPSLMWVRVLRGGGRDGELIDEWGLPVKQKHRRSRVGCFSVFTRPLVPLSPVQTTNLINKNYENFWPSSDVTFSAQKRFWLTAAPSELRCLLSVTDESFLLLHENKEHLDISLVLLCFAGAAFFPQHWGALGV